MRHCCYRAAVFCLLHWYSNINVMETSKKGGSATYRHNATQKYSSVFAVVGAVVEPTKMFLFFSRLQSFASFIVLIAYLEILSHSRLG